jgi:hypothetical protein
MTRRCEDYEEGVSRMNAATYQQNVTIEEKGNARC